MYRCGKRPFSEGIRRPSIQIFFSTVCALTCVAPAIGVLALAFFASFNSSFAASRSLPRRSSSASSVHNKMTPV